MQTQVHMFTNEKIASRDSWIKILSIAHNNVPMFNHRIEKSKLIVRMTKDRI